MDWQPIETAPRDKDYLPVWAPDGNGEYGLRFDRFSNNPNEWTDVPGGMPEGGGWYWTHMDGGPTHWLAVSPPSETSPNT